MSNLFEEWQDYFPKNLLEKAVFYSFFTLVRNYL